MLVLAPNWLGDAVMAVPCLETLKRGEQTATLAVAARGHLAPLYEMVEAVDEVIAFRPIGRLGGITAAIADARRLRAGRFDVAVLLPNSFRSALIARLAGIPARHGYATDGRAWLLTHTDRRPTRVHMVEYYRRLADGIAPYSGHHEDVRRRAQGQDGARAHLTVPADARQRARSLLAEQGWTPGEPLVGMAPGAAYGTAKQWLPERFAQLASELCSASVRTVLVGSAADREVCERIAQAEGGREKARAVINLAGRTTLAELAAVITECGSFVTNDSGAMHVAVAAGVPVTGLFGPTQEWETGPDWANADVRTSLNAMIIGDALCRPCMLRECPIEHQCMVAITVDRVKSAVLDQLSAGKLR